MYNDTIKVANKIIKYEDLCSIFSKMQEKIIEYKKLSDVQELRNRNLEYSYKRWDYKDEGSTISFDVDFYDDTTIKFDNYNNFITIFNQRLSEIKSIYVFFNLSYSIKNAEFGEDYLRENISMWIYEDKADIEVSLNSNFKKIDDVYELIKNIILNSSIKYDETIKKRSKIKNIIGLAMGFIPAIVIAIVLLFINDVRMVFANSYVLFPLAVIIIAYLLGSFIGSIKLDSLYKNIIPEKIYAGYDEKNYKSIYKDDIDQYKQTSEILIGKNVDNLKNRELILKEYYKYKKYILPELLILLILSIIILFLG